METENALFSIRKTSVECYKIRSKKEHFWADIDIDAADEQGRIQIASDYGDWQMFWGACGKPFKNFLLQLDPHYVAGKFGADKWFDAEATVGEMKAEITDQYKRKYILKADAVQLLRELKDLEGLSHREEFCIEFSNKEKLNQWVDGYPCLTYGLTPGFKMFWEKIWPIFTGYLRAEIAQTEIINK